MLKCPFPKYIIILYVCFYNIKGFPVDFSVLSANNFSTFILLKIQTYAIQI